MNKIVILYNKKAIINKQKQYNQKEAISSENRNASQSNNTE